MDFDLSPDHELIRRTVREFAEGEIAPVAEELDREKRFPYELVAQLGELGLELEIDPARAVLDFDQRLGRQRLELRRQLGGEVAQLALRF